MPRSPRVSVIVPFVESQRFLGPCVEALLSQDEIGGPVEIILVDNGATDSAAIASAADPRVTVLRETTPGAYAARNAGLRRAQAPIIAFTDADCVADRDWLRSVRDGMADPAVGILIGHCRYPAGASPALRLLGAYENAKADYVINRCPPACHFAYANNMAVRSRVFEALGPFREWPRAADTELVHRMAADRPDLRLVYSPSMRVTHFEFLRVRDRIRRLALYTQTNSRIATFRELRRAERLAVLWHLVRPQGED